MLLSRGFDIAAVGGVHPSPMRQQVAGRPAQVYDHVPSQKGLSRGMPDRLAYLCLQATHEGQASYAHVHEIIAGLERRDWDVLLRQPGYAGRAAPVSAPRRIAAHLTVPIRYIGDVRTSDAAYIRDHPMALPGAVFARMLGRPMVLEVNGPYDELPQSYPWTRHLLPLLRWSFRMRARLSRHIIVVTDLLAEWTRQQGIETPITVIANGADTDRFVPIDKAQLEDVTPYVVFVGALARWQGIDTLLGAVRSPSWPDSLRLKIAGDGVMRDVVERAAEADDRIEYVGRIPYGDVPELLARSLASLIPKSTLGDRTATGLAPLKLYEAMAAGVAVVVSDIPGQAETVRSEECGLVVPPEDAEALARAVTSIAGDPDSTTRMGRRGRAAAVARHSWDARAADTAVVLDSVIRDEGRR